MKVFVEFVLRLIFVDLKLSQNPYMPTTVVTFINKQNKNNCEVIKLSNYHSFLQKLSRKFFFLSVYHPHCSPLLTKPFTFCKTKMIVTHSTKKMPPQCRVALTHKNVLFYLST